MLGVLRMGLEQAQARGQGQGLELMALALITRQKVTLLTLLRECDLRSLCSRAALETPRQQQHQAPQRYQVTRVKTLHQACFSLCSSSHCTGRQGMRWRWSTRGTC